MDKKAKNSTEGMKGRESKKFTPKEVEIIKESIKDINEGKLITIQIPSSSTSDGSSADYYKLPPRAKQLQDLISYKDLNAQIGEIFRACYRYGECSHSDKARDMRKVIFYAKAELKRLDDLVLLDDL